MNSSTLTMDELVVSVLNRAHLVPSTMKKFTSPAALKQYKTAFTHKSVDSTNNYDYYEWFGDPFINYICRLYVKHRYPSIKNQHMYTTLVHHYLQKNNLARYSDYLGFSSHLIASEAQLEKLKAVDSIDSQSLREDLFEAFFGCTAHIGLYHWDIGIVFELLKQVLFNVYDTAFPISLSYENLFSAKDRLKLTYDTQAWNLKHYITVKPDYAVVRIPESPRELIVQLPVTGPLHLIKQEAYKLALERLRDRVPPLPGTSSDQTDVYVALKEFYKANNWPNLDSLVIVNTSHRDKVVRIYAPLNIVKQTKILASRNDGKLDLLYEFAIQKLKDKWGVYLSPPSMYTIAENPENQNVYPLSDEYKSWLSTTLDGTQLIQTDVASVVQKYALDFRFALTHPSYNNLYNYTLYSSMGTELYLLACVRFARLKHPKEINIRKFTDIRQYFSTRGFEAELFDLLGMGTWMLHKSEKKTIDPKIKRSSFYAFVQVMYEKIAIVASPADSMTIMIDWLVQFFTTHKPESEAKMSTNVSSRMGRIYRYRLNASVITEPAGDNEFRVTILHPITRAVIAESVGTNQIKVKTDAMTQAYNLLWPTIQSMRKTIPASIEETKNWKGTKADIELMWMILWRVISSKQAPENPDLILPSDIPTSLFKQCRSIINEDGRPLVSVIYNTKTNAVIVTRQPMDPADKEKVLSAAEAMARFQSMIVVYLDTERKRV